MFRQQAASGAPNYASMAQRATPSAQPPASSSARGHERKPSTGSTSGNFFFI